MLILAAYVTPFVGCMEKGPMEKAGEKVEKAGEKVDEAAKDAKRKVKDATD